MAEIISIHYRPIAGTFHKVVVYTKSDGTSVWYDAFRGSGGKIDIETKAGLPDDIYRTEVLITSDEPGGLSEQWEKIKQTFEDIKDKSANGDPEWQYSFVPPFKNCNYVADYAVWRAGLNLPEKDDINPA